MFDSLVFYNLGVSLGLTDQHVASAAVNSVKVSHFPLTRIMDDFTL
jgi:hypothetical protein